MPVERVAIERSLPKKGFRMAEQGKHRFFHHRFNGKDSGISTHVSRGTGYKTISDDLLKSMKRQLMLDSLSQVRDLFQCPMSGDDYIRILRDKNLLT